MQAGVIGIIGIGLTYVFLKYDEKSFSHIGIESKSNIKFLIVVALIITIIALFIANI